MSFSSQTHQSLLRPPAVQLRTMARERSTGTGKEAPLTSRVSLAVFVVLDAIIIVVIALLGLLLGIVLRRPPVALGFFCDDETIRYPFRDDTFSTNSTILASLFIPLFLFLLQEVWCAVWECVKARAKGWKALLWVAVHRGLRVLYLELMVILALAVTSILTEVGKIYGGQHRPWFLAACSPNFTQINCTDGHGWPALVSEDDCRPTDATALIEARKSWPSGHASTIFTGMVMATLVVYYMPLLKASIGVRVAAMMSLLAFALVVGLSRIFDYFHRWQDVLSGAILGSAVSLFVFYSFMHKDRNVKWLRKALSGKLNWLNITLGQEEEQQEQEELGAGLEDERGGAGKQVEPVKSTEEPV